MSNSPEEEKYSQLLFGFDSEVNFTAVTEAYINGLKADLTYAEQRDVSDFDDLQLSLWKSMVLKEKNELTILEDRMHDPPHFCLQVRGIFDKIIELEKQGLSRIQIAKKFLNEDADILQMAGLLDHGIGQDWGYNLIQDCIGIQSQSRHK